MDRSALTLLLKRDNAPLPESGVAGPSIFGSRARGTRVPNLFRLMQIEEEISAGLGIPVTITTRNTLHPLMKERIEPDAVRVL
jgi:predicted nucleotidyltransferase